MINLGLLGKTLAHSLSPEIHTALLKQQHLTGTYEKIELSEKQVPQILDLMKAKDIVGINVTIPYKETLYTLVDVLDSHAQKIGAINTILLRDGISYGYNTDYIGAVSMFQKANVCLTGKTIVILGSGGAAKALIYGFHLAGAGQIIIAARNVDACLQLKQRFPYLHTCSLADIPTGDIVVNTTPIGMYPNIDESPVDISVLQRFQIAADIVYNPLITKFLALAKQANLQTITGLMMLVDQAIAAQEIWLHKKLDYNIGNQIHDNLAKRF